MLDLKRKLAENKINMFSRFQSLATIFMVGFLVFGAAFFLYWVLATYFEVFGNIVVTTSDSITLSGKTKISDLKAEWGQFGDFVGGVSNPLIGTLTVVLLGFTFLAQRRQLVVAMEELRTTKKMLDKTTSIQTKTEDTLNTQINLIRNDSEINLALKLIETYNDEVEKLEAQNLTGFNATERNRKVDSLKMKTAALVELLDNRFDSLIDALTAGKKFAVTTSGEYKDMKYFISYNSFTNMAISTIFDGSNTEVNKYNFPGEPYGGLLEQRSWALARAYGGTHEMINIFLDTGSWPPSLYAGVPLSVHDIRIPKLVDRTMTLLPELESTIGQLIDLEAHLSEGDNILDHIKDRLRKLCQS